MERRVVAFVPIKLTSQRLPGKMLLPLGGQKKLCQHIFDTLLEVKKRMANIDVYCFCSDPAIQRLLPAGVRFLRRSEALDTSETKGLSIYKAFVRAVPADVYLLAHATSPFVKAASIELGLRKVLEDGYDSAFAVAKIQTFCWFRNQPLNYSPDNVIRTQEIEPVIYETSAFYIFTPATMALGRRVGRRPFLVETDRLEAIDVDEQADYDLAVQAATPVVAAEPQRQQV